MTISKIFETFRKTSTCKYRVRVSENGIWFCEGCGSCSQQPLKMKHKIRCPYKSYMTAIKELAIMYLQEIKEKQNENRIKR